MRYNKMTLHDVDIKNKTVVLRADFNVPIKNGVIQDDKRIRAELPTIEYLLKNNAKIVLLSHLSRIKKAEDLNGSKSLKPVAIDLQKKLGKKAEVIFSDKNYGPEVKKLASDLKPKQILFLENTRYNDFDVAKNEVVKLESKNKGDLGKFWASLGDVFVNDAFGTAHRAHASNVGISQNIKVSCIGFLIEDELNKLSKGLDNPKRPYIAIVGGAKISDKLGVVKTLLKDADKVLIGGGMAFSFLKALGHKIGASLVENDQLDIVKQAIDASNGKLILPVDFIITDKFEDKPGQVCGVDIPDNMMGLDIGPKTIELYKQCIAGAKTIAWNGPMGVAEFKNYEKGTLEICKAIANESKKNGCYSIIGGGDSAAAAIKLGFENKFSHISTGGGASLTYMEKLPLPGIDAICDKK